MNRPVLYSFRRCPYAMRARMGLLYAQISCQMREIILRDKPAHMLEISPKGTVPVLYISDKNILDESLDIINWALQQNDPDRWCDTIDEALIQENDTAFKAALDRYKYTVRYPGEDSSYHRARGERFLAQLNTILQSQKWLSNAQMGVTDIAIFPFIRQFSKVDLNWFDSLAYPKLQAWLKSCVDSPLFGSVMYKYAPWKPEHEIVYFPAHE